VEYEISDWPQVTPHPAPKLPDHPKPDHAVHIPEQEDG